MSALDRDAVVARALLELPVPDHGPGFWARLEASLADVSIDDDIEPMPLPPSAEPGILVPMPSPSPAGEGRRGRRLLALAAAVMVVAAAVAAIGVLGRDDQQVTTDDPTTTIASTTSASTSPPPTSPPPELIGRPTPDVAVIDWITAIGRADTPTATALTGPRTAAYLEALGGSVAGYITESSEAIGAWVDSPDRAISTIDLGTADGTTIAVVVVSGTWTGEGENGFRTDAYPTVQVEDGSWLVEPVAFDPAIGGRIELVRPAPMPTPPGGLDTMAPDGVVSVAAPGGGTFFFSLDDSPFEQVAGEGAAGTMRAEWDPPGDMLAQRHLLVVAYVNGTTVTAFAGTFEVTP